ncbi:MAG: FAD-binding oxidoreductase [Cohaesibacter sp.]|jgi:glycine/D-amino acid oxidase-like deaminating enzyme|nr:FAD-binding oxidoreductase [Cohaesibacter sp.]
MPSVNSSFSQRSFDCLVVGGGIFGLSIARACLGAGLSVLVVDKGAAGEGASFGLLGALMPHMPARWNVKKHFQFNALKKLSKVNVELQSEVGLPTGYERCGRIVPLSNKNLKGHSQIRSDEAECVWEHTQTGFSYSLHPKADYDGWLDPSVAPEGYAFDNFSARANPRLYCAAVKASVLARGGKLLEHCEVQRIDDQGEGACITLHGGEQLTAGKVVLAAGYHTFPILEGLVGQSGLGQGVKGQSLLVKANQEPGLPILYDRGTYVVPHDHGFCAIGSTSENEWQSASDTDHQCDEMWVKAQELCPQLEGAEIVCKWAGVRPKAIKRDPMIGYLPGSKSLFVATGGFKISYGIAHHIAQIAMERLTGLDDSLDVPPSFELSFHLER